MILHIESPEANNVVVFLNDKPVKHYICAKDGAEGWVEILDLAAMAPIDENPGSNETAWAEVDSTEDESEWAPLKTRKITGKVEFRRLG